MTRKKVKTWETEQAPFPARLSKIMEENRISQERLATALGVKRQTVSLYKTGQSSPNAEQILKIADFFNVSTDWLLGLTHDPERRSTATDDLGLSHETIGVIKSLSPVMEKDTFEELITSPHFHGFLSTLANIKAAALHRYMDELSKEKGPISSDMLAIESMHVRENLGISDAFIICGNDLIDLLKFQANSTLNEIIRELVELGMADTERIENWL